MKPLANARHSALAVMVVGLLIALDYVFADVSDFYRGIMVAAWAVMAIAALYTVLYKLPAMERKGKGVQSEPSILFD